MGQSAPNHVSLQLARIATLASYSPKMVIRSLANRIDMPLMYEAHARTRKDGAVGVDGLSAEAFNAELDTNLATLREALMSGSYRAPPVRRVHIPKGTGATRPIGVPTFADKVLQRAVAMVLEAVYEQDFLDCSYGFRPGRSAHHALEALWRQLMDVRGGWVIEIDIASFFDTMDHKHLRSFLDQRISDGVVRRAIDKWLKAGVLANGAVMHPTHGTPQGGVISPLLANIYLHHVLDMWFATDVVPRMKQRATMVRYADDAVLVFASEDDARRVLEVLPKRFAKYGLTLHPVKTRSIDFRWPPSHRDRDAQSFDMLGFTHYWTRSRHRGWVIKRKTMRSRLARSIRAVWTWCRNHRHAAVRDQHAHLSRVIRGHIAYYGLRSNTRSLRNFAEAVARAWRYWLNRRSQRARMTEGRFLQLLRRYPFPRVHLAAHARARAKLHV